MSEREKVIDGLLQAADLKPVLVGIGRDDDLPWAKFHAGRDFRTLAASSDESAAAEIVLQAPELGIA